MPISVPQSPALVLPYPIAIAEVPSSCPNCLTAPIDLVSPFALKLMSYPFSFTPLETINLLSPSNFTDTAK